MITCHHHPNTKALFDKLIGLPTEWFRSAEGRRLLAKAFRLVRRTAGRDEALELRDSLYVYVGATDGYTRVTMSRYGNMIRGA